MYIYIYIYIYIHIRMYQLSGMLFACAKHIKQLNTEINEPEYLKYHMALDRSIDGYIDRPIDRWKDG